MIYEVTKKCEAFYWNIAIEELPEGTLLSDYTELYQELGKDAVDGSLQRIYNEFPRVSMEKPCLVTTTNGDFSGIHFWIDLSLLVPRPDFFDPEENFEFYCTD